MVLSGPPSPYPFHPLVDPQTGEVGGMEGRREEGAEGNRAWRVLHRLKDAFKRQGLEGVRERDVRDKRAFRSVEPVQGQQREDGGGSVELELTNSRSLPPLACNPLHLPLPILGCTPRTHPPLRILRNSQPSYRIHTEVSLATPLTAFIACARAHDVAHLRLLLPPPRPRSTSALYSRREVFQFRPRQEEETETENVARSRAVKVR